MGGSSSRMDKTFCSSIPLALLAPSPGGRRLPESADNEVVGEQERFQVQLGNEGKTELILRLRSG
jgi:hypothetical protein